jgi:hypothetical protein
VRADTVTVLGFTEIEPFGNQFDHIMVSSRM